MTVTFQLPRRAVAAVGALAFIGSLGACGSGQDRGAVVAGTTSTSASPVKTTTAALEAAMITSVPSGYDQEPDAVAGTGPTDEAKAISQEDVRGGKDVLARAGYVNGYQRLWTKGENGLLAISVYVFETEAGAADYNAHNQGLFDDEPGPSLFGVAGLPGGKGLHEKSTDGDVIFIAFERGRYAVTLTLAEPGTEIPTATSLAVQQYANLV